MDVGQHVLQVHNPDSAECQHSGVTCNSCGSVDFTGIRYKCAHCFDLDLCARCEASDNDMPQLTTQRNRSHTSSHVLLKIPFALLQPVNELATFPIESLPLQPPCVPGHQVQVHDGVSCSQCRVSPIIGDRFICANCPTWFNLCSHCERTSNHQRNHVMFKLRRPFINASHRQPPLLDAELYPNELCWGYRMIVSAGHTSSSAHNVIRSKVIGTNSSLSALLAQQLQWSWADDLQLVELCNSRHASEQTMLPLQHLELRSTEKFRFGLLSQKCTSEIYLRYSVLWCFNHKLCGVMSMLDFTPGLQPNGLSALVLRLKQLVFAQLKHDWVPLIIIAIIRHTRHWR